MRPRRKFLKTNRLRRNNVILPRHHHNLTVLAINPRHMTTNTLTQRLSIPKLRLLTNRILHRLIMLLLRNIKIQPLHSSSNRILHQLTHKMHRHMLLRQQHKLPNLTNTHLNTHMIRRTIQRHLRRFKYIVQRHNNLSTQLNELNNNLLLRLHRFIHLIRYPAKPCRHKRRHGRSSRHNSSRRSSRLTTQYKAAIQVKEKLDLYRTIVLSHTCSTATSFHQQHQHTTLYWNLQCNRINSTVYVRQV